MTRRFAPTRSSVSRKIASWSPFKMFLRVTFEPGRESAKKSLANRGIRFFVAPLPVGTNPGINILDTVAKL
jgi:hypothetical protein